MGRGARRDGGGAADDAADQSRTGASESAGVGRVGRGVGGAAGVSAVPQQPGGSSPAQRRVAGFAVFAGRRRHASPRHPARPS